MRRLSLLLALLIAACATPARRITERLVDLGVPGPQARCMGTRLGDRLSRDQLRRLAELASIDQKRLGRMSVNDIVRQLDQPGDRALVAEVLRAGLSCAI